MIVMILSRGMKSRLILPQRKLRSAQDRPNPSRMKAVSLSKSLEIPVINILTSKLTTFKKQRVTCYPLKEYLPSVALKPDSA